MKRHPALIPLSHQHHDALGLCVFIDRRLKREPADDKAQQLRTQALDAWEQAIKGHFEVEETVLFPAVRPHLTDSSVIDELLEEHRQLAAAFKALESATVDGLIESLKQLGRDLDQHIRKEERLLFQAIQAELDDKSMESLGRDIAASIERVCIMPNQRIGQPS